MGRRFKGFLDGGEASAADAGVAAPGKRTLTQDLAPPRSTTAPTPGTCTMPAVPTHSGGADDPFGLHLAAPSSAEMCTSDEESWVLLELDFASLPVKELDVQTPAAYAERVRQTFGSIERYLAWRDGSNLLLDRTLPDGKTLKSQIAMHDEAQRVFFYWVSWGYHQKGKTPDQIAALIMRGITRELADAVKAAEKQLGAPIPIQGFCPRPQRDGEHYRLGTMSQHGFGNAVDIEPDSNPILVGTLWSAIESAVGRRVDRGRERWEREPDAMFDDLDQFSSEWVAMVEGAMAGERGRRDPASEGERGPYPPLVPHEPPRGFDEERVRVRAIQRLLHTEDKHARRLAALPGLRFLNHPRARVLALRDQGLVWGATFPNVDLHHFEVASPPLAEWTRAPAPRRPPTRTDPAFEESLER